MTEFSYAELPVLLISICGGIFGLLVGSFFNVLIYRMPRNMNLAWPGSKCPTCGTSIKWYQNIPVLSWLLLRGKCASCYTKISWIYPTVELSTGIAAFLSIYLYNPGPTVDWIPTVALFWLVLTTIPVIFIDFEHQLIPDSISIGGILLGLGLAIFDGGLTIQQSLLGALICGGGLWLLGFLAGKVLKKEAMGFGDVKLVAGFGAIMGYQPALLAILLGSGLAILVTIPLKLLRAEGKEVPLAFGPYLCGGSILGFIWGNEIIAWYLSEILRIPI